MRDYRTLRQDGLRKQCDGVSVGGFGGTVAGGSREPYASGSWWGYEVNGFEPDVVCKGKLMGNGFPISAMAANHEMVTTLGAPSLLQHVCFFSSAGGSWRSSDCRRNHRTGSGGSGSRSWWPSKICPFQLQRTHPQIGDVRGYLFIGVDWVEPGTNIPDPEGAQRMVGEFEVSVWGCWVKLDNTATMKDSPRWYSKISTHRFS